MVSVLNRFVSDRVQPAAARWFGQPVVEIKQISAYSCRGMNGNPRANISEHAFGNALDIAAFTLADGRKITVKDGWHGAPEEQGFLHDVQGAACEMFTTILAPGSNAYHYDHMHVDLMRHASGRVICEPNPIPGEVAAARAGGGATAGAPARRRSPARSPDGDKHSANSAASVDHAVPAGRRRACRVRWCRRRCCDAATAFGQIGPKGPFATTSFLQNHQPRAASDAPLAFLTPHQTETGPIGLYPTGVMKVVL